MRAKWIGQILHRNCLLKHITEGKAEETGRQEQRHKQRLGYLQEIRIY
jgi:hypothetical protein